MTDLTAIIIVLIVFCLAVIHDLIKQTRKKDDNGEN